MLTLLKLNTFLKEGAITPIIQAVEEQLENSQIDR